MSYMLCPTCGEGCGCVGTTIFQCRCARERQAKGISNVGIPVELESGEAVLPDSRSGSIAENSNHYFQQVGMDKVIRDRLRALVREWRKFADECQVVIDEPDDEHEHGWARGRQNLAQDYAKEIEQILVAQPAPAVMGEGENWWTAEAIDVIRHARTNEPHDDWNDWQNAITNGILRAYNRGRTAAAESREEPQ